jgi:hypothetical protein
VPCEFNSKFEGHHRSATAATAAGWLPAKDRQAPALLSCWVLLLLLSNTACNTPAAALQGSNGLPAQQLKEHLLDGAGPHTQTLLSSQFGQKLQATQNPTFLQEHSSRRPQAATPTAAHTLCLCCLHTNHRHPQGPLVALAMSVSNASRQCSGVLSASSLNITTHCAAGTGKRQGAAGGSRGMYQTWTV